MSSYQHKSFIESFFTDRSELINERMWLFLGSVSDDGGYVDMAEPPSTRRLSTVPIPASVKNGRLLLPYQGLI